MARPADPNARVELLRAAERVFGTRGLDGATIADITVTAGLSKGAFYLHFVNKEDAFRQIVESMLARMTSCIEEDNPFDFEAPGRGGHSLGTEALREVLERWHDKDAELFEFVWQNRRVVRLLLEGGRSATFSYMVDEFAERCRVHTKRFLAWGVGQGVFRADLDVEVASLVIAGAYDRVARQIVHSTSRPDLRELCLKVQALMVSGLGSPLMKKVQNP